MILERKIGWALGLGMAMAFSSAGANEPGWYIGLNAGQSQADVNKDELDAVVDDAFFFAGAPITSGSSSLEDSDTAWSVFGGYRLNPFIAFEAGYANLGTAEYRASGTINPPGPVASAPANFNADFEVTGFTVAAIGSIPINDMFGLHARVGVLFSDTEITLTGGSGTVSVSETFSASAQDLFYGVGAALHLGGNWSLNLDYQLPVLDRKSVV